VDTEDKDYPFLCMDITFIYAILTEGFGLPNTKEIFVCELNLYLSLFFLF